MTTDDTKCLKQQIRDLKSALRTMKDCKEALYQKASQGNSDVVLDLYNKKVLTKAEVADWMKEKVEAIKLIKEEYSDIDQKIQETKDLIKEAESMLKHLPKI